MLKPSLSLRAHSTGSVVLRSIDDGDIDLIRRWKNEYRFSFFHSALITEEMQRSWYCGYRERVDDHILIVLNDGDRVGCVGFRRMADRVDLYNIIRGAAEGARDGTMSRALELVSAEARARYPNVPIMVSVLRSNPALGWYCRRGFRVTNEHAEFVELTLEATVRGESE